MTDEIDASYGIFRSTLCLPKATMTRSLHHQSFAPTRASNLHIFLAAMLAFGLLSCASDALAKRYSEAAAPSESAKKRGVSKITYQRSASEESTADRDRRLYRECKGMHNAGACRGYTRK